MVHKWHHLPGSQQKDVKYADHISVYFLPPSPSDVVFSNGPSVLVDHNQNYFFFCSPAHVPSPNVTTHKIANTGSVGKEGTTEEDDRVQTARCPLQQEVGDRFIHRGKYKLKSFNAPGWFFHTALQLAVNLADASD
ncbi:unnamed protein product [Allacma fusca]|uniref:Uncharacterized protein n=1 Tax=Allacma fusca TaxID=39272 RepID=A0A8J2KA85_9HEXA|nr:unnamed protein product [Allacma fusca]